MKKLIIITALLLTACSITGNDIQTGAGLAACKPDTSERFFMGLTENKCLYQNMNTGEVYSEIAAK